MDVDPAGGMGPFGHDPRDQRNMPPVQQVCQALDRNGLHPGIGDDDLVVADRGRVTLVCRLHIRLEHFPHADQVPEKLARNPSRRAGQVILVAIVTRTVLQALVNLVLQTPCDRRNQLRGVGPDLVGVDRFLVVKPRKNQP